MSSPVNPNTRYGPDTRALANTSENKSVPEQVTDPKTVKEPESIALSNKKQLNAAIIESTLKFSSSVGDQPLSLLLKTALQGINEALQASGVENNVEAAFESGTDFSPQATAERIVAFSTQFISAYQEQHPDMAQKESLTSFVDIIKGGIEQGFGEAKDILSGLEVLAGDISDNIEQTYQLVQQGLQAFVDDFSDTDEEK
ncbi:MAG: DUF5610 domain-containing protein [Cognaticolwellia sp.]